MVGRFISSDGQLNGGFLGNNMFAYCENNPVNRTDSTGRSWAELWNTFVQTLQQASGYFLAAAGVSQVDSPAPGPADVASAVLLLGGLVVCAGIAIYTTTNTTTVSWPPLSFPQFGNDTLTLEERLEETAKSYEIGECVEAANAMKAVNGGRGNIINLYFPNAHNGFVCCDRYPNMAISENKNHYGYLYEGRVWCNIYPEGLPQEEWISKFYDASGTPPIVTIR